MGWDGILCGVMSHDGILRYPFGVLTPFDTCMRMIFLSVDSRFILCRKKIKRNTEQWTVKRSWKQSET